MAVRRTVGYLRYDTTEEYQALQEVYQHLCPLLNFYYPSARLIEKIRIGSKVKKIYEDPKPPYQRLLESKEIDDTMKRKLKSIEGSLHIMKQKRLVDAAIEKLTRIYEEKNQIKLPIQSAG